MKQKGLQGEIKYLKDSLKIKDQQIAYLKKMLFGQKSEKFDPNKWQLELGFNLPGKDEALSDQDEQIAQGTEEKNKSPKRKRRKKSDILPDNLMVRIVATIIPPEVIANPENYRKIGEEHHDEVELIAPQVYIKRTITEKYISLSEPGRAPINECAPLASIPGTKCGPSLMAEIISNRFVDSLPYYRQTRRFARQFDVHFGKNTLEQWAGQCAFHLKPINDAILAEVLSAPVLEVDETPIKYLEKGTGQAQTGYFWAYLQPPVPGSDQKGSLYYHWQTGRSHRCLLDILQVDNYGELVYRGAIQCDGYSAYETLSKKYQITLGGCLAHVRRKFYDAREERPIFSGKLLSWIQRLYQIEESMRQAGMGIWHREQIRQRHSRPILTKIYDLISKERENHLPKSGIGEAISYALGRKAEIEEYLSNPYMEIDNNLVENAIRPTKIGAKNWMFIGAKEAGWRNALYYTLMGNCKIQKIDPQKYLTELLQALPSETEEITPELAAEWTPAAYARRIAQLAEEKASEDQQAIA